MQHDDLNALWSLYQRNIVSGRQYSLRDCGIEVGARSITPFVSSVMSPSAAQARVQKLTAYWALHQSTNPSSTSPALDDERRIFEICMQFLHTADQADAARFHAFLDLGVPVNFQHPRSLETALHITCSRNTANRLTEQLLRHRETDFMLRDHLGRRAWNNAVFFGLESTLAQQVLDATLQQAIAEHQSEADFHSSYREDLRRWISTDWYEMLARRKGDIWESQI